VASGKQSKGCRISRVHCVLKKHCECKVRTHACTQLIPDSMGAPWSTLAVHCFALMSHTLHVWSYLHTRVSES
jgi:hypothetical protein